MLLGVFVEAFMGEDVWVRVAANNYIEGLSIVNGRILRESELGSGVK